VTAAQPGPCTGQIPRATERVHRPTRLSIISDQRTHTAKSSPRAITRQIRIALRQDKPLTPDTDQIAEVVIAKIIRLEDPPLYRPETQSCC
jgi:hypothetical protein